MSRSFHFICKSVPGYGPPDSRCLPCTGVSAGAVSISPNCFRGDCKLVFDIKSLSVRCASRNTSVCNASSSNYQRNPDFSRQNKHGFSRNKNRHNEERDGYEDFEDSETFSSKNGPFPSVSGNQKFQATATPGPREKEIVELFRKVQVQLRERAATKEERKIEDSRAKSKESETVDSLLKLLRKHSVQQGKKNTNASNNREFILDQTEQVRSTEERSTSILDSDTSMEHETKSSKPHPSRPKSNFQKRSPVPEIKFQSVYTEDSVSRDNLENVGKENRPEPEADDLDEFKGGSDSESEAEPIFSEGNVFDETLDNETSEIFEDEQDDAEASDLSEMKVTELRALAKSRGIRGFSKLKKNELIALLSDSSI